MRIRGVHAWQESFGLTRPYRIAYRMVDAVDNMVLRIETGGGLVGLGTAAPAPYVTGESLADCRAALDAGRLQWLVGRDVRTLPALCRELGQGMARAPAARAAADMALHDLYAQALGLPLVEVLGRAHPSLPTSITIGIKPVPETLDEAAEYLGRGFRVLKVKLGKDLDEDLERLRRLRERFGGGPRIRVDPNQGYDLAQALRFGREAAGLDIELLEQPVPAGDTSRLRELPESVRAGIAADEGLVDPAGALALAAPPVACGIFNIKLMKCGGVAPALRIAAIAETAGLGLMWGCMDESVVGISAALHAALASPATRYLDLDGSFDLARDVAEGGFVLEEGRMRTTGAPGLGARMRG